jgi:exopolyphosphatase/guanosine-5'-triphosphate,3'-diphosphate pyrophosphatase
LARATPKDADVLAAVDLGSNSFHMIVARYNHGQLVIIDRLREPVRLADGLDEQGRLNRESVGRALQCLQRFGQRLSDMHAKNVRVVGTNTLRRARRKESFLERAQEALGHRIEIISGVEEARMIYLGVAHTSPGETAPRLVVDIGGGSTEFIIGEGLTAKRLESLYMGCISFTNRYFANGDITEKRMKSARTAVQLELEPMVSRFQRSEWQTAFGASGTIRTLGEILQARGAPAGTVDREGLDWILEQCLAAGSITKLRLPELSPERAEILPGGLAILVEVFARLGVDSMRVAEGALREGLLYDLLGRLTDEDARARSVRALEKRFHVDAAQADRVEATAMGFLASVREAWGLDDELSEQILGWAARLHEIGLDISHTHYHRHGAYLLQHADLPGFPHEEQQLLAIIVGGHRRKLSLAALEQLTPPWDLKAERLIVLLRVAVLLHRGRGPRPAPEVALTVKGRAIDLAFPRGWLHEHPLTIADLEQETEFLRAAGLRLRVT